MLTKTVTENCLATETIFKQRGPVIIKDSYGKLQQNNFINRSKNEESKKKAWKWEVNVCQEREISSLEQQD